MVLAQTRAYDQIKFATIHHSGVLGIPANVEMLKRRLASHEIYHCRKNFPTTDGKLGYTCLLYHYAIAGDGTIVSTQDPKWRRWHATDNYKGLESANLWGIGILLEGNFNVNIPTDAQLMSAAQVVYSYDVRYNVRLKVRGHKEFAAPNYATDCPGVGMGLSTSLNSRLSIIVNRIAQLHAPVVSNVSIRLDVLAEIERTAIANRDRVNSVARKDEWERSRLYAVERRGELNG